MVKEFAKGLKREWLSIEWLNKKELSKNFFIVITTVVLIVIISTIGDMAGIYLFDELLKIKMSK